MGATIVAYHLCPTVLHDPAASLRVSTEELFAPVVCLNDCQDIDVAVVRANLPDLFFQRVVFTNCLETALDLGYWLHEMAVMLNENPVYRVAW